MNKLVCPCCGRKYNLKALIKRREELWNEYCSLSEPLMREIEKEKKIAIKKGEKLIHKTLND